MKRTLPSILQNLDLLETCMLIKEKHPKYDIIEILLNVCNMIKMMYTFSENQNGLNVSKECITKYVLILSLQENQMIRFFFFFPQEKYYPSYHIPTGYSEWDEAAFSNGKSLCHFNLFFFESAFFSNSLRVCHCHDRPRQLVQMAPFSASPDV